jgi:hypothetical protein
MRKCLFLIAMFLLASLTFAKSYTLSVTNPTKVGGAELAKGVYRVSIEGDNAVFTDDHYKRVSVPVKVESGTGKKFDQTTTATKQVDGVTIITQIYLGGSNTILDFGN